MGRDIQENSVDFIAGRAAVNVDLPYLVCLCLAPWPYNACSSCTLMIRLTEDSISLQYTVLSVKKVTPICCGFFCSWDSEKM